MLLLEHLHEVADRIGVLVIEQAVKLIEYDLAHAAELQLVHACELHDAAG